MGGFVCSVFLVQVLQITVISLVLVSVDTCGQYCPSVASGWDRTCNIETTGCGFIPERSETPSAPMNVKFKMYPYHIRDDAFTLAANITWQLPENATGLTGFVVELQKASYPVGFQQCKQISFSALSNNPSFTSEATFSVSCWHDIDVDGLYNIRVRSLDSGQSFKHQYHTSNCYEQPKVRNCLVDCASEGCQGVIPPADEWRPQNKPTADPRGDQVNVEFDIYPGNYWLTYRVNLYSYELNRTPTELSHTVNTNGSSGRYKHRFENVKPGRYQVKVKIKSGDAIEVSSEDFDVSPVTVATTTVATTTVATATFAITTPQAVEEKQGSTSGLGKVGGVGAPKDLPKIVGGVGAGVAIAFFLLVTLVIRKWPKRQPAETGSGTGGDNIPRGLLQSDDMSDLVNNMVHNDVGQNDFCKDGYGQFNQSEVQGCGDSYLQGSLWTDVGDVGCVHTVEGINRDMISNIGSFGGESGIPV